MSNDINHDAAEFKAEHPEAEVLNSDNSRFVLIVRRDGSGRMFLGNGTTATEAFGYLSSAAERLMREAAGAN